MWLIIQIFVGVTLAFIALAALAALWWHLSGRVAALSWRHRIASDLGYEIRNGTRELISPMRLDVAALRNTMRDSAAALNEGLHQNAQAGRVVGRALAVAGFVPLVFKLGERLIFRRQ